jgi:hypothetical protein
MKDQDMKDRDTKDSTQESRREQKDPAKTRIFRRSVFYAVCLFVVYQLMLIPLQNANYAVFWITSVIGFLLVIVELLYSQAYHARLKIHVDLPHLRQLQWRENMLHHVVIPTILYSSGVLFLFFNQIRVLDQVAVVLLCGTFFVMLYNVSAAHLKMYQITRQTRSLYDFVNIIVFYFVVDILINLMLYYGLPELVVLSGSAVTTFLLIGLMVVVSRQFSFEVAVMLLLTSLMMGLIVLSLWHVPIFNIAVISVVATVAFYLFDVYWHHQLEGSFTWDAMSQYILFAVMAVILLLYI